MIRTKASIANEVEADSTFQLVKFEGRKRRLPKTAPPKSADKKEDSDSEFERVFGDGPKKKPKKEKEVTFQSARREVINYGISGSASSDKINLNQQLAIKLGAKPDKKVSRNYKKILEEKRQQKDQDATVNRRTIFGTSASLQYRSQKHKSSRKNVGLTKRYGKVEKANDQPNSNSRKRKR